LPSFLHSRRFIVAEALLALLVLSSVFLTGIEKVSYGEDESHWIHTSSYLEILFTHRPDSPLWGEHYWTLTQPPVARYLIGLGRLAGGYHPEDLNTPWQFDQDYETNVAQGNLPASGLLWWSRLPMAALAALAGWLVFLLLRAAAGRIAGYYFLLAFLGNAYFLTHLRRAMSETPLLFFTILAAVACWRALHELHKAYQQEAVTAKNLRKPAAWSLVAGACCGLAGACKINGLFSAGGLYALCPAVARQRRARATADFCHPQRRQLSFRRAAGFHCLEPLPVFEPVGEHSPDVQVPGAGNVYPGRWVFGKRPPEQPIRTAGRDQPAHLRKLRLAKLPRSALAEPDTGRHWVGKFIMESMALAAQGGKQSVCGCIARSSGPPGSRSAGDPIGLGPLLPLPDLACRLLRRSRAWSGRQAAMESHIRKKPAGLRLPACFFVALQSPY